MINSSQFKGFTNLRNEKKATNAPRILLISGVPPGSGGVGEIILRDLCRVYPRDYMCCFAITNADFTPTPDPRLDCLPMRIRPRRYEHAYRPFSGRLGSLIAMTASQLLFKRYVSNLVDEAVRFGRERHVEKVWMVLNSGTTIAMGPDVALQLGVPLLSLVWDPPAYLLRTLEMDRFTRSRLLKRFSQTLQRSERVAVVSEAMQNDYSHEHGAEILILRHGLPATERYNAATHPTSETEFLIGFAGSLYALSAWQGLIRALDSINWRLDGRTVVIRILALHFRLRSRSKANIEYLGWRSLAETTKILAGCDVNYLPVPFEPHLQDLARYSFPTKLSTYLAAVRPVFIHAPQNASVSIFFERFPVGSCCNSLDPGEIVAELKKLSGDRAFYSHAARQAAYVANREFNMEQFHRRFAKFIGVEESQLILVNRDKYHPI